MTRAMQFLVLLIMFFNLVQSGFPLVHSKGTIHIGPISSRLLDFSTDRRSNTYSTSGRPLEIPIPADERHHRNLSRLLSSRTRQLPTATSTSSTSSTFRLFCSHIPSSDHSEGVRQEHPTLADTCQTASGSAVVDIPSVAIPVVDRHSPQPQPSTQQQPSGAHPDYAFPFATRYKYHPAISSVALGQSLWATIVRPDVDTVIDATCGNGYDSVAIARLLFRRKNDGSSEGRRNGPASHSQLMCLDVQEQACQNTMAALRNILPPSIMDRQVNVINTSHERLPRPTNTTSVGLVVYNLGWLPNSNSTKDGAAATTRTAAVGKTCVTTTATTISSMTDAILLLRVGGMLSVVTYPRTDPEEADAVRLFLTCLSLLSSNVETWEEEVDNFVGGTDKENETAAVACVTIAKHVTRAMERVVQEGAMGQTWRVSKHEKLGMDRAPILLTATRIK
jgi:hypothetical protein